MRSLQRRLSIGLMIALTVLVGLLLAVGSYSLRHLAEAFIVSRLEHDMEALMAALSLDADGRPVLDPDRLDPVFRQPYSGHYYKIRTPAGELRSRSLWDTDLEIPPATTDAITRRFATGPQDQQLLVLARAFRLEGQALAMAVTEDFSEVAEGLRRLTLGFTLLTLPLLAGLVMALRLIVRRGLSPLEAARQDLMRLERGEIRQLPTDLPVEVRPLVEEVNRLTTLMEQRLQRSRNALGNLAHALKGSLTVLTQLASHSQIHPLEPVRVELERQTRQIRDLIDRELKRARIAGAATPGQRAVLAVETADLVDTLKRIHRDKALSIDCRIPPETLFPGDRADLLELLGNLLDNACQWAAGRVRLTTLETADRLRLTVEDDGPGCSAEQLEQLTRRGARIDESRAGHGLGLAIVADIVEQYSGRLRLGRSPALGGFLAEVEFPSPHPLTMP